MMKKSDKMRKLSIKLASKKVEKIEKIDIKEKEIEKEIFQEEIFEEMEEVIEKKSNKKHKKWSDN